MEGPITLTQCVDGESCELDHMCSVKPHWPVVNAALRGALAGIPLTQIATAKVPA